MNDGYGSTRHIWRFFRAGGFDQVLIESSDDLTNLPSLDQKLWVALNCPVSGVEFDKRTLSLVDTDGDGFIRANEILNALSWVCRRIRKPADIFSRRNELPLDAVNDDEEEGKKLSRAARMILENVGKSGAGSLSVDDVDDIQNVIAKARFNGDGIVPPDAADDDDTAAWITDIIGCFGGKVDRTGKSGITTEILEAFLAERSALLEWTDQGNSIEAVAKLGADTETLLAEWGRTKPKIEDFFLRCRLAAYDSRAASLMMGPEDELKALASASLAGETERIAALPLAAFDTERTLPLCTGVNPAWSAVIDRLHASIITPLIGERDRLTEDDWNGLKKRLELAEAWLAAKPKAVVAGLGINRLRNWHQEMTAAIRSLIERDLALREQAESVTDVERLVRYHRDLDRLLNNFVSFRDFYTHREKASFQAGTLYIDGRSCDLCVPVADVGRHAALATLSRIYLVYCDCVRAGGAEKMTIAAAITSGDSDQLMVGRNGVFYDRSGRDWNATVVRIVDHPISIRQAFFAPYKRIARMIGEQVQKLAAARSKDVEERAAGSALKTVAGDAKAQLQPFDVAKFAGIFAAIGLAIGAIGTAVASVVTGFLHLAWWQMPLAVAVILLLISGPSMIIASFKLSQRNLGPLLDANGWAVNARARLNIPFGTSLTGTATLPEGARQILTDPFAEKKTPWGLYVILLGLALSLIAAWLAGWLKFMR